MNIIGLMQAFRKGKELSNVKTWKRVKVTSASLAVVIKAVVMMLPVFGIDLDLNPDAMESLITNLADGFANLMFVVAAFLIPTTTKKIGILPGSNKD